MPRLSGLGATAPRRVVDEPKTQPKKPLGHDVVDAFEPLPKGVPVALHPAAPSAKSERMVASYNVENLFDTLPDAVAKDGTQFTPDGDYKWSEAKLERKLANLGQSIRALNGGKGPDILALNEVENAEVVARLRDEALSELGYDTLVHLDSGDKRGIDNAILSKHPLVGEPKLHVVHRPDDPLWKDQTTRGILEASFDVDGTTLTVFVNHWPAGLDWSQRRLQREDVGKQLRKLIEAKLTVDPKAEILVLGDMNASPGESSFGPSGLGGSGDASEVKAKKAPLYGTLACLADQLRAAKGLPPARSLSAVDELLKSDGAKMGTHYDSWSKRWNCFDQLYVSPGLLDEEGLSWVEGSTQIARSEAIATAEAKPKSTFPSSKYAEHEVADIGVSDHFPLVARLRSAKP